jgi:uncharacterized protein YjeT (DUF2065 family)
LAPALLLLCILREPIAFFDLAWRDAVSTINENLFDATVRAIGSCLVRAGAVAAIHRRLMSPIGIGE